LGLCRTIVAKACLPRSVQRRLRVKAVVGDELVRIRP
jgi:hypothetical protein